MVLHQVDDLVEVINQRAALALHKAAAAALAAIDGPDLRQAASLLIETACYQHPAHQVSEVAVAFSTVVEVRPTTDLRRVALA